MNNDTDLIKNIRSNLTSAKVFGSGWACLFALFVWSSGCSVDPQIVSGGGSKNSKDSKYGGKSAVQAKARLFNAPDSKVHFDPTSILVEVDGCVSGYTGTAYASGLDFDLYVGDSGCRAKVRSFVSYSGEVFAIKDGESFGYDVGSVTPFVSNMATTAYVVTAAQLTSPLLPSDEIEFSIYRLDSGGPKDVDVGINIVRISGASPEANEADGAQISFTVSKVAESGSGPLDVFYTLAGSAEAGSDYIRPSGVLTIAAGQTSATQTIDLINDSIGEPLETITVSLTSDPSYYHYGLAQTLIYDDDAGIPATSLVMHLDPSGFVITPNEISEWTDLSLANQTVNQPTPANQPIFSSGAINGFDGATFDGSDDVLRISNSSDINSSGPFTKKNIYMAFATGADVLRRQIIFEQGGGSNCLMIYLDSGQIYFSVYASAMSQPAYLSTTVQPNFVYHVSLEFDAVAGTLTAYLFDALIGVSPGVMSLPNHGSAGIGGSNGSKVYFHDGDTSTAATNFEGTISEIVYYNGTVEVGTTPSVQQFLASKYAADPLIMSITAESSSVLESGGGAANYKITASRPRSFDQIIQLTVTGKAVPGIDYEAMSTTLTMPAYTTELFLALIPIDDQEVELGSEDVVLTLQTSPDYELGLASASIQIIDDESPGPVGDYVMWLSAESGVEVTSDFVTAWLDSSSYAQTVTQSNESFQPIFDSAIIAGKGALIFDGVDDFMVVENSPTLNTSAYDEKSIGLVFESPADVITRQVIYEEGGTSRGLCIYLDQGRIYFNVWGSSSGDHSISNPVSPLSVYKVLASFSGLTSELNMRMGATDVPSVLGVGSLYSHTGAIGIGKVNGRAKFHDGTTSGIHPFSGKIADIIYYNSVLSNVEEDALFLYYDVTYPTSFDRQ